MSFKNNSKKTIVVPAETIAVSSPPQVDFDGVSKARLKKGDHKTTLARVGRKRTPAAAADPTAVKGGSELGNEVRIPNDQTIIPRRNTRSNSNNKEAYGIISKFKEKSIGLSILEDVEIDDDDDQKLDDEKKSGEEWTDNSVSVNTDFLLLLLYYSLTVLLPISRLCVIAVDQGL